MCLGCFCLETDSECSKAGAIFYLFQLTANITDDFFEKHFYKAKNAPCNQELFFLENVSLYKMNNIVRISQLPSLKIQDALTFLFICLHTLYI